MIRSSAFACLTEACYIDECMVLIALFFFPAFPFGTILYPIKEVLHMRAAGPRVFSSTLRGTLDG
jgi:hypothetical protein